MMFFFDAIFISLTVFTSMFIFPITTGIYNIIICKLNQSKARKKKIPIKCMITVSLLVTLITVIWGLFISGWIHLFYHMINYTTASHIMGL